jgi:hypothetical protein
MGVRRWEIGQYGSVSQRLKSPHMKRSPPTRTNLRQEIKLTEPYWEMGDGRWEMGVGSWELGGVRVINTPSLPVSFVP